MVEVVHVRQAFTENDIVEVAEMWTRSAAWLRGEGLDQWQYPVKWDNIRTSVATGACWLVTDHEGRTSGTITIEFKADPYWDLSEDPDDALYVHRMVVETHARGRELGSALLDWAARSARQAGKSWLRLDAWKSNPALHQYYLDHGFTLVRIDDNPTDPSGACFQRPATIERHTGPRVLQDNTTKNREIPPSDGAGNLSAPDKKRDDR